MSETPRIFKSAKVLSYHGETYSDDYFWMREKSDPRVLEHLKAENAHTDAATAHLDGLRKKIYGEILSRTKETDVNVPAPKGPYEYYSRTEKGKSYVIHCRKRRSAGSIEEIILDENELARDKEYFHLGSTALSADQNFYAYAADVDGSEEYVLRIRNLVTGNQLDDEILKTAGDVEWMNDGQSILYTTFDETKRPYRLFLHKVGTPQSEDRLLLEEKDGAFFLGLSKSRSEGVIFVEISSKTSSEAYYIDARAEAELHLIQKRIPNMEFEVFHWRDEFLILTNLEAKNFKLVRAPMKSPSMGSWKEVLPYDPHLKLDHIDVFRRFAAIYLRDRGLSKIRILDLHTNTTHDIEFDEETYSVYPYTNFEFDADEFRFAYSSLRIPHSIYSYQTILRKKTLLKRKEVPGGYDPDAYESHRIVAKASDGTEIPVSILHRKGLQQDGMAPALLAGYGSYGHCYDPGFSSAVFSLVDRGFVYAIAHIRGGGEVGRPWYEDGKLLKKKNTFDDFIVCASELIARNFTSPARLGIIGGSAGGLLMGAVMNLRPDLFRAVVARVPFVDVLNTMMDAGLPLTVTEYEEWGNPQDRAYFDYIRSYSPYENVKRAAYPALLATAGLNDPRVSYWEPAKWVARLREYNTSDRPILLRTEMGAGHGGPSGRYRAMEETAFIYAFLLDQLLSGGPG